MELLRWSVIFLIIALVAGGLGFSGIAQTSSSIAWLLFVVFLILFIIAVVMGY